MKRWALYIGLLITQVNLWAQQDAIYSQYMFNQFAINPAYAGSRNSINVVAVNRSQWVGINGAPNTQSISAHVPMSYKNVAWGANVARDQLGPNTNLYAAGTAAYQLLFDRAKLTFALRGGIYNSVFDAGQLNFREENDLMDTKEQYASVVPTFDFGMYYYTNRFYTGLSITHLTKHRFNYGFMSESQDYFLRRHAFLTVGYVYEINEKVVVKPSTLVKYTAHSGVNADLNINALFNKLFWLGVGVRNFSSINFLMDVNVTDYLRVGYAYDLSLTKIKNFSYGSHELMIGFDFNLKKAESLSPRYL